MLLDGELVVWAQGRLDFTALQQRLVAGRRLVELVAERPTSLVVFDLLRANGEDLMARPWSERRARLEAVMADTRAPLQLCPATTDRQEALVWFDAWAALGVEGLVAKGQGQPYMPGRRGWLKVRHRHGAEAVVGAVVGRWRCRSGWCWAPSTMPACCAWSARLARWVSVVLGRWVRCYRRRRAERIRGRRSCRRCCWAG
jgi:ATP-dependent DNA ligase